MSSSLIAQISLIVLAGGGLLVLVAATRYRRHRDQLMRLASKHSLGLATGDCSPALLEKAGRYRGVDRKVTLKHVLVGRGESASVVLAQRKVRRERHQVLFFELGSSAHLEGFYVRPEKSARSVQHELSLQWRAPRSQWSDERALSMAARVMYNISTLGDRTDAAPIGVEVNGRRVWIHSRGDVRGAELDRFVDDAMRLRTLFLKSLQRANEVSRNSGRVAPAGASRLTELVRA